MYTVNLTTKVCVFGFILWQVHMGRSNRSFRVLLQGILRVVWASVLLPRVIFVIHLISWDKFIMSWFYAKINPFLVFLHWNKCNMQLRRTFKNTEKKYCAIRNVRFRIIDAFIKNFHETKSSHSGNLEKLIIFPVHCFNAEQNKVAANILLRFLLQIHNNNATNLSSFNFFS